MQSQEGALSFSELVLNASFLVQCVMLFLLILSVVSWTIIFSRNNQYRIGRAKADEFEDRFWSGIDLNNLYQECMKRSDELVGLEVIYSAGFKEFVRLVNSGPADQDVVMDGTYRQMKVACSREIEFLENHLPTLATIGSISPYIGLFGTVWGIMHAFVALAAVKNATLAMVAPPIAEALIATAMGLFAAIPAVMFYNRFVNKVEALENRYYNFMDEFSTILNRRLVTIRTQLNRQNLTPNQSTNVEAHSENVAPAPVVESHSQHSSYESASYVEQVDLTQAQPSSQGSASSTPVNQMAHSASTNINANPKHLTSNAQGSAPVSQAAPVNTNSAPAPYTAAKNSPAELNSAQAQAMAQSLSNMSSNAMRSASQAGVNNDVSVIGGGNALNSVPVQQGIAQNPNAMANNMRRADNGKRMMPNNAHMNPNAGNVNNVNLNGLSANPNQNINAQVNAHMNDPRLAQSYRGVVPPRNNNANMNAQLPNGMSSGVKPNMRNENVRNDAPLYKVGGMEYERARNANPNVKANEEPHYIPPGGQTPKRPPQAPQQNKNNMLR